MARETLPSKYRDGVEVIVGPHSDLVEPTTEQKQEYCARIAIGATMHAAAAEVGLPYLAFGRALISDETFAHNLEVAKALRPYALEEILLEQCTVGVDKPLTYQGHVTMVPNELTGEAEPHTIKELITSNPSLIALLKANNPQKFRDKQEIWHHDGADDEELPTRITGPTDREKLIAALSKRALKRKTEAEGNDEDLL